MERLVEPIEPIVSPSEATMEMERMHAEAAQAATAAQTTYYNGRRKLGDEFSDWGVRRNVINALYQMVGDARVIIFMDEDDYKLTGVKVRDRRVIRPSLRILEGKNVVFTQDRLNVSVRTFKDVKVIVDGGRPADRKQWRTYNIIVDGELNEVAIEATLSARTFKLFQNARMIEPALAYEDNRIYGISFEGLPLFAHCWARPDILGLVPVMREEKELMAERTAVKARIAELGGEPKEDEDDVHKGRDQKVKEEEELYLAPCVEWRLMMKRRPKPENYDYSEATLEQALQSKDAIHSRLNTVRRVIGMIKFACEKTHSKVIPWESPEITHRGEYPKEEQIAHFKGRLWGEAELKRVTWTEPRTRSK